MFLIDAVTATIDRSSRLIPDVLHAADDLLQSIESKHTKRTMEKALQVMGLLKNSLHYHVTLLTPILY